MFKLCRFSKSIANFSKISRQNLKHCPSVRTISFKENVQKFKSICKRYWYIVLPIHVTISAITFTTIYILTTQNINMEYLVSYIPFTEDYAEKLKSSKVSHFALAILLYKILTPARYAATFVVATILIKYLKKHGKLK